MFRAMKLVLALALGAATVPLTASPAAAHDYCWANANAPGSGPALSIWVTGSVQCWIAHGPITTTTCLQYALVDADPLYGDYDCRTEVFGGPFGYVGTGFTRYCPFDTGFYRVTFTATMDGHTESAISDGALIVSRC